MSSSPDLGAKVRALTREPGYGELLAAIRSKLQEHAGASSLTLPDLKPEARRALADLLGRKKLPDTRARIRVAEIDERLLSSRVGARLIDVLEALGGPLADHRAEREETRAAWSLPLQEVERAAVVHSRSELLPWAAGLREDGLLRRIAGTPTNALELVRRALAVVACLPARGMSLSVIAAQTTGDPHALDHGTPLATLVLRAALCIVDSEELPATPAARRRLWSQVGVVCDALSSDVLVLGLRASGGGLLGQMLEASASHGEPLRLTLRALRRHPMTPAGSVLYVCENPAVIAAAADALGPDCAPLVCTEGMPGVAADELLSAAKDAGVSLRFHSDFDWGGVRIGNLLAARYGARAWRFSASDYEAVLAASPVGSRLRGRVAVPSWDRTLGDAMQARGVAISEEHVVNELLSDLATRVRGI
jgi:uncharacterized protein (TIGR02679 family)